MAATGTIGLGDLCRLGFRALGSPPRAHPLTQMPRARPLQQRVRRACAQEPPVGIGMYELLLRGRLCRGILPGSLRVALEAHAEAPFGAGGQGRPITLDRCTWLGSSAPASVRIDA